MKDILDPRTEPFAKERRQSKKLMFCAALAALLFHIRALPSDVSPGESIRRFFDLLLRNQVQEAADSAFFSDQQAKARFIEQWTAKVHSLSRYTIEGWTIEPPKGSADLSLEFHDPADIQALKIRLVKVNGPWNVAPQKELKSVSPISPSLPEVNHLQDLVHVKSTTKNRHVELSVVNEAPFSVLFHFEMTLSPSLRADRPLPVQGILPPARDPLPLCNLRVLGRTSWKYSSLYLVKRADDRGEMVPAGALTPFPEGPGNEDTTFFIGGTYAYGLPYPAGNSYLICQGPAGDFSHNEPGSRHAVDFSMPLGSEIAAARAGVVIGVIQMHPDNPDEKTAPASRANEIFILHPDGTIGVYAHLTTQRARVSFGETVDRGQVIGLSGNSGYSRGPHLHFAVLGYNEGRSLSLPFVFLSAEGTTIPPRKALILLAGKDGVARTVRRESTPRRVVRKCYEDFDADIRYFAKDVDFLAINKTDSLLWLQLSLSSLENLVALDELPRKVALPADGAFHPVTTLQLIEPGERCAFVYVFWRVEPPVTYPSPMSD